MAEKRTGVRDARPGDSDAIRLWRSKCQKAGLVAEMRRLVLRRPRVAPRGTRSSSPVSATSSAVDFVLTVKPAGRRSQEREGSFVCSRRESASGRAESVEPGFFQTLGSGGETSMIGYLVAGSAPTRRMTMVASS